MRSCFRDVGRMKSEFHHHANISMKCRPTDTPLLYSKIGVNRGLHYFLIFALNRDCVGMLSCFCADIIGEVNYDNEVPKAIQVL